MKTTKKALIVLAGTVAALILASKYAYSSTVPVDTNKKVLAESIESELISKFGSNLVSSYLNDYYNKRIAEGGEYAKSFGKLKLNKRNTWDGRDWAFFVTAINTVKYDYLPK